MELCRPGQLPETEGPTAVVLGMFDGVHIGHAAVIRAARETGLRVTLVTFTRHPASVLKNRRAPALTTPRQRERLFARLGVDVLCALDFSAVKDLSPEAFVRTVLVPLRARYVFCGFNYTFGEGGKAGPDELARLGARFGFTAVPVPPVCDAEGPVSSTRVRVAVEGGRMEEAAGLLGRPFELEFEVVHGRALGRRLGIPTINQILPEDHVRPRFGVYAASVLVGDVWRGGVCSVGVKPTVGSNHVLAETNIFDYDGDLYGRRVRVALHAFLRPEERFDSVELLKEQMQRDTQNARAWLAVHPHACAGAPAD